MEFYEKEGFSTWKEDEKEADTRKINNSETGRGIKHLYNGIKSHYITENMS